MAQEQESSEAMLLREEQTRNQLEQQHAGFAAVLVPLVLLGSAVTIFLLALANARQRTEEIGILRAVGLKARQIIQVFLSKAAAIGLAGGLLGIGLGFWIGWALGGLSTIGLPWQQLFAEGDLLITIVASPVLALILTGIASWVPALLAAQQDPAVVLQGG
ncbi:MAG TPA: FtsX-like permease family protein [Fuerstia sp.]|nr:FtsX-like permease family protein [Fuerstiella sp.]